MTVTTTLRVALTLFSCLAAAVSCGLAIAWSGRNGQVSGVWALDTIVFTAVTLYIMFFLDNSRA